MKNRRWQRWQPTARSLAVLKAAYQEHGGYPSCAARARLTTALVEADDPHATIARVRFWFQNQRQRRGEVVKKQQKQQKADDFLFQRFCDVMDARLIYLATGGAPLALSAPKALEYLVSTYTGVVPGMSQYEAMCADVLEVVANM